MWSAGCIPKKLDHKMTWACSHGTPTMTLNCGCASVVYKVYGSSSLYNLFYFNTHILGLLFYFCVRSGDMVCQFVSMLFTTTLGSSVPAQAFNSMFNCFSGPLKESFNILCVVIVFVYATDTDPESIWKIDGLPSGV